MKKPQRTVTALCLVVLGALLAVLLAGCGSSKPDLTKLSVPALFHKASAAVAKKKYISLSGRIASSNGLAGTGLDLHYVDGDSYGEITLGNGAQLRIESVGGKTWFKPNAAFWRAQMGKDAAAILRVIAGRWILANPDNANFGQVLQLASRDFIAKQVLDPKIPAAKGSVTTIAGTDCIPLRLKAGTLYLNASTALPVRVAGTGKSGSGAADFSYAKVSAPIAPTAKQQVDLSSLTGQ
ncbi:hypothetical protein [Nocardioides terrisoli]|uniref:hypothetical protein n=1 Tax=Nocardioides terrisoli TaxID=3388267 RepID=UPI00287B9487|nr:hypothetical protein [Nocardioides marmorisolisilvae]